MSPEQRLHFHQVESGPRMKDLEAWFKKQFAERKVEPNSGLGEAILIYAEILGQTHAVPAASWGTAGQQHRRANAEDSSSKERAVLQGYKRLRGLARDLNSKIVETICAY
jgi:hypothetical protein